MADTIRELVIQAIVTRLAIITVAGGYNSDIGEHVQRTKMPPVAVPGCNVWPQPETSDRKYQKSLNSMQVLIEAVTLYGSSNPSQVSEQILGDLKKAMLDPSWLKSLSPNYIESVSPVGGGADDYPNEEDNTVGTKLMILVKYLETIGDPYSQ